MVRNYFGYKRVCPTFYTRTGFMCERRDTSVFFATKARRHKVSRSLSVILLCLCVFAADFFGYVKSGTGRFFCHEGTKTQSFTKSLRGSFVSLWLIFSDM
ncbi:Uncharacterized protein dnm_089180 [Desulfonema magnum]|uniref:Uncharacterized protein n=1 Tax=Desulfonema magnum TaxID=45655 RepID=A0A975BW00_9BACT|nr:Uncharacterized protein dnm_089180 [Desulfonema magnum]